MYRREPSEIAVALLREVPELASNADNFVQTMQCILSINPILECEAEKGIAPDNVIPIHLHRLEDQIKKLPNKIECVKAVFLYYTSLQREVEITPSQDDSWLNVRVKPQSKNRVCVTTRLILKAYGKAGQLLGYFGGSHNPFADAHCEVVALS